jgi:phage FluMu protein gp41
MIAWIPAAFMKEEGMQKGSADDEEVGLADATTDDQSDADSVATLATYVIGEIALPK